EDCPKVACTNKLRIGVFWIPKHIWNLNGLPFNKTRATTPPRPGVYVKFRWSSSYSGEGRQEQQQSVPARRKIALALQGGGSHGAFTWGVLDRILDDPTIEIIGVTGTSAGAMNATALVGGLLRGGAQQARTVLGGSRRHARIRQLLLANVRS